MSPLQLAGGINGIDGIDGTAGLGLPIYALSGIDMAGGRSVSNDQTELMAIVSGLDFEQTMNGLGNAEDATFKYLVRTRDFLLKNKTNKNRMAHIQNPDQFIEMLNQAIKHWNTSERDKVLDKLIAIEDKLVEHGFIKYDATAIEGAGEFDDLMDEIDGLEGKRKKKKKKGKGKFFKAVKKVGKKVGKVAKKVVKAIVKFNPLSIAIRGGTLIAMRLNMFGIAKKLQYAYLPDNLASKYNVDPAKLKKLKSTHKKVLKLFKGLQGKEENLKKAILKGAKQKSPDFSLNGTNGVLSALQYLESVGELSEMGNMGAVATGASVTAASGVLATITGWLKKVGNVFSKAKEGSSFISKFTGNKSKKSSGTQASASMPSSLMPASSPAMAAYSGENSMAVPNPNSIPKKKGMGKGAKVGIGIGVAALIGTGAYFMLRKKKSNAKSKPKSSSKKESLGRINLT